MTAASRYRIHFFIASVLLGIPSYFAWFRRPFDITEHEFDLTLGLFYPHGESSPIWLYLAGSFGHAALIGWISWAFFRLVLELAKESAPLTWEDIKTHAVLVLPYLFYLPWLSPDVFFYFGTGWIQSAHGLNPYERVIADAPDFPGHPIYQNIYPAWNHIITPYGPLFCKFIKGIAFAAQGNVFGCLILLKVVYLMFLAVSVFLAARIARILGMSEKAVGICFLLHPAVLIGYLGREHNDIVLMACMLGGVFFALKEKPMLCIVFFALGAGFKYVPVIVLPCFFVYFLRGNLSPLNLLRVAGLGVAFVVLTFLPSFLFENGVSNFHRLLVGQDQLRMNPFYLVIEKFVTKGWMEYDRLKMVLKSIFFLIYACILLRLFLKGAKAGPQDLFFSISMMFIVYFLIGSPEIHEWYAGWFMAYIFWINQRVFFEGGMILTCGLHILAIFTGNHLLISQTLACVLMFALLWIFLGRILGILKCQKGPSPLFLVK